MIEGWDKGPRDRTKTTHQVHEGMDWIYRLGPRVVIEVRDLNGTGRESLHRVRTPLMVATVEDALRVEEERGRKAAMEILSALHDVNRSRVAQG